LPELDATLKRSDSNAVNPVKLRTSSNRNEELRPIPAAELMGNVDLPVHSIVQGGPGALILSSDPFTHVARPHNLLGIKDAYGVLVVGNSMAREYNEGDIAYVNPHLHPRQGDACIFQRHHDDGTVEAKIKYLERSPGIDDPVWHVSQTNPAKKFTLKRAEWQVCQVCVGKQSGR
jgi:phage repressor protein C with HTH and peptisase S24 domain